MRAKSGRYRCSRYSPLVGIECVRMRLVERLCATETVAHAVTACLVVGQSVDNDVSSAAVSAWLLSPTALITQRTLFRTSAPRWLGYIVTSTIYRTSRSIGVPSIDEHLKDVIETFPRYLIEAFSQSTAASRIEESIQTHDADVTLYVQKILFSNRVLLYFLCCLRNKKHYSNWLNHLHATHTNTRNVVHFVWPTTV